MFNILVDSILVSFSDHEDSFVQTAVNMGNTTNAMGQQHPSPALLPLSSHAPNLIPSPVPNLQIPSPLSSSSAPPLPVQENPDSNSNSNRATNLVKPSSFFTPPPSSSPLMMPPVPSSTPTAPPLHPPLNLQRPYGTPMLQPFPPPTPSPSLAPNPTYGPVITKDEVRDAFVRLAQVYL